MKYKVIKSEEQYDKYLTKLSKILDAEPGSDEFDELELLSLLISKYEEDHEEVSKPNSEDIIKYIIEQRAKENSDYLVFGHKIKNPTVTVDNFIDSFYNISSVEKCLEDNNFEHYEVYSTEGVYLKI